ncbi:MAG: hypothetical protein ACRDGS_06285, partial [Chloroflexota bacterium]
MSLTAESARHKRLVPEDLLRIAVIDDVALAPQGDLVAMTIRTGDAVANRNYAHLRIVPVDGSPAQSLPVGEHVDHAASWSPDASRLAFLSDRTGQEQLWLTTPDGSEPRQITSFPLGVRGQPAWSPDGRCLAIAVVDEDEPGSAPAPIVAADSLPFSVTHLCYRVD